MMSRNPIKSIFYVLVAAIAVPLFTACNNEDKAIRQMCEEIHAQYPVATLQDIYKTCYQDYFGAEHLMSDTAAARQYLQKELDECRNTDMSFMPKSEPTGFRHRFTRINLSCIVDGELTEEQLLTMFINAAGKDNAYGDTWMEEWQKIEHIALKVCPDWTNEPLQAELRLAAEGKHAVRHSEAFRNAYNPHYRIVSLWLAFLRQPQRHVFTNVGRHETLPRKQPLRAIPQPQEFQSPWGMHYF